MKQHKNFSDEMLNAFIDDQLDYTERAEVLSALRYDQALTHRVCELQKVRSLVQLAYSKNLAEKSNPVIATKQPFFLHKSLTASLFLLIGILSGWVTHEQVSTENNLVEMAQTIRTNKAIGNNEPWRLMLHVSNDDAHRFNVLLKETEHLLQQYRKEGRALQVEILANSKAVNLLQDQASPQAHKLMQLEASYSNLVVSACGETLKLIRQQTGQNIKLLPDTHVVRSAIYQVSQRQKQGWTYIHI